MSRAIALGSMLVIGAAVAFLIERMGDARGGAVRSAGAAEETRPPGAQAADLVAPSSAAVEPEHAAPDARRVVALDERREISGRVLGASTVPAGESVRVTARIFLGPSQSPGKTLVLAAAPGPDGAFAFTVPADAREVWLELASRFLSLPEPVRVLPGATDVVLAAETLAVLEGRVLPPRGTALAKDAGWKDVNVAYGVTGGGDAWGRSHSGESRVASDGSFAFPRVIIGVPLELRVKCALGSCRQLVEPLAAGERRVVELVLEPGITVAGHVVDEHGVPVPGVRVTTARERTSVLDRMGRVDGSAETDANGRFELADLPRESLRLLVSGRDLARGGEAHVDGALGDVPDVRIAVERGGCIEGTVEWPDGRPASRIAVFVTGRDGTSGRPRETETGRFRTCALRSDTYEVEVSASEGDVEGRARATGVRPGDPPLRYVLEAERVYSVIGKVVDRDGEPVPEFRVLLPPSVRTRVPPLISGKNGVFAVDLPAGEWTIGVTAAGMQAAKEVVHVAPETTEVRFTLLRAGRVRGQVLDAHGLPVARAMVTAGVERGFTGADGRFDIAAPESSFYMRAESPGHAPSEVSEIALGDGESISDVIARLRPACRVAVRVLDAEGRPVAGARVAANASDFHESERSDARGEIRLVDLPSGPAILSARLPDGSDGTSAEIVLAEGDNGTRELRLEPPDPVRVHGRVVATGGPAVFAVVLSLRGSVLRVETDADGRFEVTLPRPGAWTAVVLPGGDEFDPSTHDPRRCELAIPDAVAHDVALDFDALQSLRPPGTEDR